MPPSLPDLPTELIEHILQDELVKSSDIYAVGIVCKRLNSIAIPLLLQATGVTNLEESISLTFNQESLHQSQFDSDLTHYTSPVNQRGYKVAYEAAIMVAFYISSIREVNCNFPQSFTDPIIIYHFKRLSAFLARLKLVKSVTIYFKGDQRYRHLSVQPVSEVTSSFADAFSDIIQSLSCKGCKMLQLYDQDYGLQEPLDLGADLDEPLSRYSSIGIQPAIPGDGTKSVIGISRGKIVSINSPAHKAASSKGVKGFFGRTKATIDNALRLSPLLTSTPLNTNPPSLSSKNANQQFYAPFNPSLVDLSGTLHSIHIQTPFALLPRCLPAIRNIIYSSSNTLTSLTLSYIVFDENVFDSCLSSLSLTPKNAITHLSILHCRQIPPKSFLEFLINFHSRLEILELDRGMSFVSDNLPPHRLNFYKLHTLKAPIDWVTYFVTDNSQRSVDQEDSIITPPLPNLSFLTIQCRTPNATYFTYEIFRPILDIVLETLCSRWEALSRYSSTPRIDITLDIKVNRDLPWQMDQDRAVLSMLKPYIEPNHQNALSYTASLGELALSKKHLPVTTTVSFRWRFISKLVLFPTYPLVNSTKAEALARWVTTLFPGVRQVTIPPPFIPHRMPQVEYEIHQKKMAEDAAVLLRKALHGGRIDEDAPPLAWKTLVMGQWTFFLGDLDVGGELSQES